MEYYSAIKRTPFAATWMDLEIIILNEVRERQLYCITYVKPKNSDTNERIYKEKQTPRLQIYGYQKGKLWGREKLGGWDQHIQTSMHKIDNQQGPTV